MYYTKQELYRFNFLELGDNVKISKKASIYGANHIKIGSNVRIDDFCVLSAGTEGFEIGSHVHIAVYAAMIGKAKITLGDFCGISSRVTIYSSNDDYSGNYLTGPTLNAPYTNVTHAPVDLGKHVIVGSGTIILPGVVLGEGVAVGANSLVNKSFEEFQVIMGVPAKYKKNRSRKLLELESKLLIEKKVDGRDL